MYSAALVAALVAAPAKGRDIVGADEGCDTGVIRRAPWRLSAADLRARLRVSGRDGCYARARDRARGARARKCDRCCGLGVACARAGFRLPPRLTRPSRAPIRRPGTTRTPARPTGGTSSPLRAGLAPTRSTGRRARWTPDGSARVRSRQLPLTSLYCCPRSRTAATARNGTSSNRLGRCGTARSRRHRVASPELGAAIAPAVAAAAPVAPLDARRSGAPAGSRRATDVLPRRLSPWRRRRSRRPCSRHRPSWLRDRRRPPAPLVPLGAGAASARAAVGDRSWCRRAKRCPCRWSRHSRRREGSKRRSSPCTSIGRRRPAVRPTVRCRR